MRILVLGAGAVGGYFGGRLVEAGRDVTFLLRPHRAAQIARQGLILESPVGNATLPVKVATDGSAAIGSDVVILACKAYDLETAIAAIEKPVQAGAVVLPLLNGLAHIDRLRRAFGQERVIGGMCQILATLSSDGTVRHLDKGARLVYGRFAEQIERQSLAVLMEKLDRIFTDVNFTAKRGEPIERSLWDKWLMLATLAAATSLMRGSIGQIMASDDGAKLIGGILAETVSVARAAGYPPSEAYLETVRRIVLEPGSPAKASLLRDIEKGGRIEGAHLIGDMLRRAQAFGLETPLLQVANCHLQVYEANLQPS
ncbi:ketopantoate reductase family protein [Dongia soli]|uniref:2-dehydropantoate 2-reductase n=1 Tax=Dongia soli TaxID=600628 RepID=A0ABU5E5D8_9PROT|nr:ketopantoate reductase family protein [Dongia soli]MDY0881354.1 ketopantoate reductase family protein [Dongia soli]